MLIEDTVYKPAYHIANRTPCWWEPRVDELNSGLPRTNPDSGRVEDLNQEPPDL